MATWISRSPVWSLTLLTVLSGCALTPRGTVEERRQAQEAGRAYQAPVEERQLLDLPERPDWRDVLQCAFLANGELEATYHAWDAALSRIMIESAWPNTRVGVGFDYMFSDERMKAWDRTTVSVGFDQSMMLQFPTKTAQAGKIALAEARAAGQRFTAAKFKLQEKTLTAWWDYTLLAEKLRVQQETVELLRMQHDVIAQRVRAGDSQQDLLEADTQLKLAINELADAESDRRAMRAMLNGMLARPADAALIPPGELPEAREIPVGDDVLLAAAVDRNPELAALASELAGRADAVQLAQMAYIPDIVPQFSVTGSVSQAAGAMVMLPTTLRQIRASIDEARSVLRGTEAMTRQARFDRAAQFVATLTALRNHERQARVFERSILANAKQSLHSTRQAYVAGKVSFADLIDSQRMVLDARLLWAEARMARERRLAELERLMGVDIETLAANGTVSDIASAKAATDSTAQPKNER